MKTSVLDLIESRLTPREREAVLILAGGKSNKQIAAEMGVKEQVVKNMLLHSYDKLGCSDRLELGMWIAKERAALRGRSTSKTRVGDSAPAGDASFALTRGSSVCPQPAANLSL